MTMVYHGWNMLVEESFVENNVGVVYIVPDGIVAEILDICGWIRASVAQPTKVVSFLV